VTVVLDRRAVEGRAGMHQGPDTVEPEAGPLIGPEDRSQGMRSTWPASSTTASCHSLGTALLGHASRTSLEIYSRVALADAQHSYDKVIERFPV
jgi:hypothetical protein